MDQAESEYLSPPQLAGKINMSKAFIDKYTREHRLPGMVKMGRFWRYRLADVEKQLLTGQILLPMKRKGLG
jgi:predicted DNA-binding transcriptional regulator AlpA